MSKKILKDRLHYLDEIHTHPQTLWARTQILGGYGRRVNSLGISSLDEVIFETENMVPLIGVQYALETIFGVKGTMITIPTLNESMQIGAQGVVNIPKDDDMPYAYGQRVCLFGIGDAGAAENNLTALEVKYNETNVSGMIPFRYTDEPLSDTDQLMYYGKGTKDGHTAYYLKKFDQDPIIKHLYKNGLEGEDGSEVNSDFFNGKNETGIQSFAECCLTISKKDVREWYAANGHIELSRINSIGLYTAVYDTAQKDFAQIQLFSKLNIPTEPLSLSKDMNIIYRVYGA